jgi:hypothetical protein
MFKAIRSLFKPYDHEREREIVAEITAKLERQSAELNKVTSKVNEVDQLISSGPPVDLSATGMRETLNIVGQEYSSYESKLIFILDPTNDKADLFFRTGGWIDLVFCAGDWAIMCLARHDECNLFKQSFVEYIEAAFHQAQKSPQSIQPSQQQPSDLLTSIKAMKTHHGTCVQEALAILDAQPETEELKKVFKLLILSCVALGKEMEALEVDKSDTDRMGKALLNVGHAAHRITEVVHGLIDVGYLKVHEGKIVEPT